MENASEINKDELEKILSTVPGAYEDFASCTAAVLLDLNLVDEFIEYHAEAPEATADAVLQFVIEQADL